VGIGLWVVAALCSLTLARIVPQRRGRLPVEAAFAVSAGVILGTLATLLDFGGWDELDGRAFAFVFFGTSAILGTMRVIRGRP